MFHESTCHGLSSWRGWRGGTLECGVRAGLCTAAHHIACCAYTKVREICNVISNDIQPVGNLRVLNRVGSLLGPEPAEKGWARHFIGSGFAGGRARM